MGTRVAVSSILDRQGNPIRYHFFDGVKKPYGDSGFSGATVAFNDTQKILGQAGWQQLVRNGRFLFANVPMVRGAFLEKASYSFPLEPQYAGADTEWGETATKWLYDWDQDCTLRGAPFDQATCSRIRMLGRQVDGDILTVLTEDPDTQYPKTQLVRAHRVGSRVFSLKESEVLKEGPWAGNFITNGVVFDRIGRWIGVRVLVGDDPRLDVWVPASACRLDYRPDYADQARGISELVASIPSIDDLKRLNEYEMRAQNAMSSIAIIEKNETGYGDETADTINRAAAAQDTDGDGVIDQPPLVTETYESGSVRYFRSGTGSGLEAFRGDRPSPDAAAFEQRIVRRAFYGIEWDADFALALKEPGGAWARTILQKINRSIANVQAVEARTQWWIHTRALARAVYTLKVLPKPKDGDIFSWNYRGPAKITADSGNDENAKRNNYILGTTTLQDLAGDKGKWWKEIRKQREVEVRDKIVRAKKILDEFPELGSIQIALKLMEDTSPMVKFEAAPQNTADAETSGTQAEQDSQKQDQQ